MEYINVKEKKIKDDISLLGRVAHNLLSVSNAKDHKHFKLINDIVGHIGHPINVRGRKYYKFNHNFIQPEKQLSPTLRFHHKYAINDWKHGEEIIYKQYGRN